jgi:hypothetical protein
VVPRISAELRRAGTWRATYNLHVVRRRFVYVLLFAVPALLLSAIAAAFLAAASAGVLWLFVFGDSPWPPSAGAALGTVLVVCGGVGWVAMLAVAYAVGKRQESRPRLNRAHVLLAAGLTVVLVGIIGARSVRLWVGGPATDEEACADICRDQGFPGSGTPPRNSGDRTCSCYDALGTETRRIPLPPRGSATGSPR